MRDLSLARRGLVFLIAFVIGAMFASCPARAQDRYDHVLMSASTLATTYCVELSDSTFRISTVVRAEVLEDTSVASVVLAHEAVHRADMAADPKRLCRSDRHTALLLEVHAYCVSDRMLVRQGYNPLVVYAGSIQAMMDQFRGSVVTTEEIVGRWSSGCPFNSIVATGSG